MLGSILSRGIPLALCASVAALASSHVKVVRPPKPVVDTASVDTSGIAKVYEYIAYPVLQAATWPLQNVLAPAVEFLTYPTQPPIRYFLEENVIDRAAGLFQVGSARSISVYPTVSLASGTASRTGGTFRDDAPFGRPSERLVAYFYYFVNGDVRLRSLLTSSSLWGTPLRGKLAFSLTRYENDSYYMPDVNEPYFHGYDGENYEIQVDAPLAGDFYLRAATGLRNNRYFAATGGSFNPLEGGFFMRGDSLDGASRGFGESFLDRSAMLGLVRDTRNNENIPVDGDRLETGWRYHDVDGDRDYLEWTGRYTTYLKLGSGRYELTRAEEAARGGLSLDRFLRNIEYQRLRRQIFERKVLVFNLYGARSFELPGDRMPFYGAQSLGNSTPLRAYPGSRYRNYAVAAASAEYRFPLLRIMDGVIFNEYGAFGPALTELDPGSNLRNSWGFGVRVRRADMFLFRIETAFHGLSGFTFNASTDTPF